MLVCYLFWMFLFLYINHVVAANATCVDDMKISDATATTSYRNHQQIVNKQVIANSTRYISVPTVTASRNESTRSKIDTNIGRSESEARWWLVPYYGPYYEFYVNEYSYKFWAAFQLATVIILLYSAFAAIYFAKYTFLTQVDNIKEDDLLFWWRSFQSRQFQGLDAATYQRIMDSIHPT